LNATKNIKFRLKDAEQIYNLAMDRFYKQDKKGFNIVVLKHKNNFQVSYLPVVERGKQGLFILVNYKEMLKLVRMNLDRQIRKKEAIDMLHKETNKRIEKFKIVFIPKTKN